MLRLGLAVGFAGAAQLAELCGEQDYTNLEKRSADADVSALTSPRFFSLSVLYVALDGVRTVVGTVF